MLTTAAFAGAYECSGIERLAATEEMLTMLPFFRASIARANARQQI